jgi:chorismate lyase/3-hydroxybenzoate synthase
MNSCRIAHVRAAEEFPSPVWVQRLFKAEADRAETTEDGSRMWSWHAGDFGRYRVHVRDAWSGRGDRSGGGLSRIAQRAYESLLDRIGGFDGGAAGYPVRIWNYIPGIHDPGGEHADRYHAFNAGRFEAWRRRVGDGAGALARDLPTASAVGHSGRDLVIEALTAAEPGAAVENPRQIPSYRYSKRFGDKPPCFARATAVGRALGRRLLVGGTASIVGEESAHQGDLGAQIAETLANLSILLAAAWDGASRGGIKDHAEDPRRLTAFSELRVYFVRDRDLQEIRRAVARAFPGLAEPEFVRADLCRRELLVEMEGVAELPAPNA